MLGVLYRIRARREHVKMQVWSKSQKAYIQYYNQVIDLINKNKITISKQI